MEWWYDTVNRCQIRWLTLLGIKFFIYHISLTVRHAMLITKDSPVTFVDHCVHQSGLFHCCVLSCNNSLGTSPPCFKYRLSASHICLFQWLHRSNFSEYETNTFVPNLFYGSFSKSWTLLSNKLSFRKYQNDVPVCVRNNVMYNVSSGQAWRNRPVDEACQ